MRIQAETLRIYALGVLLLSLAGCGGGDGGSSNRSEAPTPSDGTSNAAPVISGRPATSISADQAYVFQPSAQDPEGDRLTFAISNMPSWATFDPSTGRLSGTPSESALGAYAGIAITVTDGRSTVQLNPFSIEVVVLGNGAATLSWTPPLENTDGSSLQDLAGYRVMYGRSAESLNQTIEIRDPSLSAYVVENLTSGTWYFTVVAVNSRGAASDASNLATKVVS